MRLVGVCSVTCLSLIACAYTQSDIEANIAYDAFENICLPVMQEASKFEDSIQFDETGLHLKLDNSLSKTYPELSLDYSSYSRKKYSYPLEYGIKNVSLYKPTDQLPSSLKVVSGPREVIYSYDPSYKEHLEGYQCALIGTFSNLESVNSFKFRVAKIYDDLTIIKRRKWHLYHLGDTAVVKENRFCSDGDTNFPKLTLRFSYFAVDDIHGLQRFKISISDEPCDTPTE